MSYHVAPPSVVRNTCVSLIPQPLLASTIWMAVSAGALTTGALIGSGVSVEGMAVGPGVTGRGMSSGVQAASTEAQRMTAVILRNIGDSSGRSAVSVQPRLYGTGISARRAPARSDGQRSGCSGQFKHSALGRAKQCRRPGSPEG